MSYTYNATGTLATKTDAKNQQTVYTYDSKNRVTMLQRMTHQYVGGPLVEDTCQRVTYTYDTNPVNANFSQYSAGRLTTIQYYGQNADSNFQGCIPNNGYSVNADTYTEMYSYLGAGAVTAKNVNLVRNAQYPDISGHASLEVDYTYDNAGRQTNVTYPMAFQNANSAQPVLTTGYDAMGRPSTLTDTTGDPGSYGSYAPTNWVSGVQYDFAGRLTNMSYLWNASGYGGNSTSESRTYNVNGQLASIIWGYIAGNNGVSQIQYSYSATQNNGQIKQEIDNGTAITYQYDVLSRLTSASGGSMGTQTFQYDGFGNLTAEVLNGTTTPIQVDAATNRLLYASYDANGNMTSGAGATFTYDEANRVTTVTETSGGEAFYGYDASNRRIYQRAPLSPTWSVSTEAFIFYGARGENLGRYAIISDPYRGFSFQPWVTNLYFGRRLVAQTGSSYPPAVRQDRLGTNRSTGNYYPFGDGAAGTDNFQFATYTRDSYTGIDYADQRYYASTYGRFLTTDPMASSAKATDPGSWNRYSYVRGDPVNYRDKSGAYPCLVGVGEYAQVVDCEDETAYIGSTANFAAYAMCLPACLVNAPADPNLIDITHVAPVNTFSQVGIDNAKAALTKLSTADLSKCAGLLGKIAGVGAIQSEAATDAGYVYDGASSTSPGSLVGIAGTIGSAFSTNGGIEAASQPDGHAIWVRSATWGSTSPVTLFGGLYTVQPALLGADG